MNSESTLGVAPLLAPRSVALVLRPDAVPLDVAMPFQAFGPWPTRMTELLGIAHSPYVLSVAPSAPDVTSSLPREPALALESLTEVDTVLVPGVTDPLQPTEPGLVEALRAAHHAGVRILSICTGAFALAAAGLLDGRPATTHWMWIDDLRERYPLIDIRGRELFVDDGDILTSAGVLAGADLSLHVIRSDYGSRIANTLARFLVSAPNRPGGQAQYILPANVPDCEDLVTVVRWIGENLAEPLSLQQIARQTHVSVRTLTRRFRESTGGSVAGWIVGERVRRAQHLLETTDDSVSSIALACGFGSTASLRAHFHEHTLTTPTAYRLAFR